MPTDRFLHEGEVMMMDHDVVVREQMTEKYLLDELDPEVREEFEDHFFDCQECAEDIRAGSEFVAHSKIILAKEPKPATVAAPVRVVVPALGDTRRGWFSSFRAGFRPAFAIPLMAALLAVIGYQNLVTLPNLAHRNAKMAFLPATTVNLLTYGGESAAPLVIRPAQGFLVNVIVPPGQHFEAYKVALLNPAGSVESVPISASAEDTWPIQISGSNRRSGSYKLTVLGVDTTGHDVEVGSNSFQLKVEN